MMKVIKSFLDLAEFVLLEERIPMTVDEIWDKSQYYVSTGVIEFTTNGKTPTYTLSAQLYTNVKKINSRFEQVSIRPTKFGLVNFKNLTEESSSLVPSDVKNIEGVSERDLHPYFVRWNLETHQVRSKTIFHERSIKNSVKNGDIKEEWLYPDIIGIKFPFYYDDSVNKFAKSLSIPLVQVFSYEMKREINNHNLRAVYFQAVSNSSWANEGYLVTSRIKSEDLLSELSRLNNMFGIGVILLNIEDLNKSEILLPAKQKDVVDMNTLNHLALKNPDVKDILESVIEIMKMETEKSRNNVIEKSFDEIINVNNELV